MSIRKEHEGTGLPAAPLSPSQIVFLRGELFVHEEGELALPSGVKVALQPLAETALAAAFLGCAAQQLVKLQIHERKRLLGLRKSLQLFATPQPGRFPWLDDTLEARLLKWVTTLASEEEHTVSRAVYLTLGRSTPDPWHTIVTLLQEGLIDWWMLERVELQDGSESEDEPPIRLSPSMAVAVLDIDVAPVQSLLQDEQIIAPRIQRLLEKEIKQGLNQRLKRATSDPKGEPARGKSDEESSQ
jgi:hypothetical protein